MTYRLTVWTKGKGQSTHDQDGASQDEAVEELRKRVRFDEVRAAEEVNPNVVMARPKAPRPRDAVTRAAQSTGATAGTAQGAAGRLVLIRADWKGEDRKGQQTTGQTWLKSAETCHVFSPDKAQGIAVPEDAAREWIARQAALRQPTDYCCPDYSIEPAPAGNPVGSLMGRAIPAAQEKLVLRPNQGDSAS